MKRIIYLFYYFKETDWKKLKKFRKYNQTYHKTSSINLWFDVISSVLKYNISILDYFYFRFQNLNKTERQKWAGTGFMYEYQLIMNPISSRNVLEDKNIFLKQYSHFVKRQHASLEDIKIDEKKAAVLLSNKSGKIVVKNSKGQVGAEVEVVNCDNLKLEDLIIYMNKRKFNLVEEYVIQHSELMKLSPSGLNTVRLITQLVNEDVVIVSARLRISVNSFVDNMAAGNMAAPIDIETGIINSAAVYSDITKQNETIHPITGIKIIGFKLPFWEETIKFVKNAALHIPQNRSVGWDIAITENGPELIEGNHNWCKLLWQLPVKQGLKVGLVKYLNNE